MSLVRYPKQYDLNDSLGSVPRKVTASVPVIREGYEVFPIETFSTKDYLESYVPEIKVNGIRMKGVHYIALGQGPSIDLRLSTEISSIGLRKQPIVKISVVHHEFVTPGFVVHADNKFLHERVDDFYVDTFGVLDINYNIDCIKGCVTLHF